MTMHRLKNVVIAALVAAGTLAGAVAAVQASTLDSVLEVGETKNQARARSQVKIDRLADETRDLLSTTKRSPSRSTASRSTTRACSARSTTR